MEKINSLWHHRYEGSDKFISYSIKYHLNVGIFNEDNELVAWCLRYDSGSLGMLQVAEKERRKGYGSLVSKIMCKKIAKEFNSDVISSIVPGNVQSEKMFSKIGFKNVGPHCWIVAVKNSAN